MHRGTVTWRCHPHRGVHARAGHPGDSNGREWLGRRLPSCERDPLSTVQSSTRGWPRGLEEGVWGQGGMTWTRRRWALAGVARPVRDDGLSARTREMIMMEIAAPPDRNESGTRTTSSREAATGWGRRPRRPESGGHRWMRPPDKLQPGPTCGWSPYSRPPPPLSR